MADLFDAYRKASSTKMIAGLFDAYSLLEIGTYKPSSVVTHFIEQSHAFTIQLSVRRDFYKLLRLQFPIKIYV